jgi:hypothetical protein
MEAFDLLVIGMAVAVSQFPEGVRPMSDETRIKKSYGVF